MKKFLVYTSLAVTIMTAGITHVSAMKLDERLQRVETEKNNVITHINSTTQQSIEKYQKNVENGLVSLYTWSCWIMEMYNSNEQFNMMMQFFTNFYKDMRNNIKNTTLEKIIVEKVSTWVPYGLKTKLKECGVNKSNWTVTEQSIDQWGKEQTEIFKKFFNDLKEKSKKNIEEKPVTVEAPAKQPVKLVVQNEKIEEENTNENQPEANEQEQENTNENLNVIGFEYIVAPDNNEINEVKMPEKTDEQQEIVFNKQDELKQEDENFDEQEGNVKEKNTWQAAGYSESMKKTLQNLTQKEDIDDLKTAWQQFKPTYEPRGYFCTPYCNCTKVKNPFLSKENYKAFEDFVQLLHKTVTEWRKDVKALTNQPNDNDLKKIKELGILINEISLQLPDMLTTCIKDTETKINKNAAPLLEYLLSKPATVKEEKTLIWRAQNVIVPLTFKLECNDNTKKLENTALFRLNEKDKNEPYFDIIQNLKKKLEMK